MRTRPETVPHAQIREQVARSVGWAANTPPVGVSHEGFH
jgi:hypothetical protein